MAAVLVFSAGFMSACGDDDDDTDADDTSATTAALSDTTEASSDNTITLIATNFAFDKTTLTATAGQEVTFTITNNGSVTHNLTIADLEIDKDAEPGASGEQTVTPDAGTYPYFCEYHPSGMKGTLTVS